jgi:indole-3-glycerol phosphate synthase
MPGRIFGSEVFLSRIISHKRKAINQAKRRVPLAELEQLARVQAAPRNFRQALTAGDDIAVIAEMKKASPSAGVLREDFDASTLAQNYVAHGAAALSILTDESFFQGHLDHLLQAREACSLPLLRKDFIVDPYQVFEARAHGADAVLLIAGILDRSQLLELLMAIVEIGMQALAEVHSETEIDSALLAGADLIGINNRDLQTFEMKLETTEQLAPLIPRHCVRVAESGIASRQDVERLAACGVDAILVGSHFMRHSDPGQALTALIGVPRQ